MSDNLEVQVATSSDSRFPPTSMLDNNDRTFWLTTGMFPQECILSFLKGPKDISKVKISGHGMSKLRLERCTEAHPTKFESMAEGDVENRDQGLQLRRSRSTVPR